MASSLEIAQAARLQPIVDVAEQAGIHEDELELYGRYKAKVCTACSTGSPQSRTGRSSR